MVLSIDRCQAVWTPPSRACAWWEHADRRIDATQDLTTLYLGIITNTPPLLATSIPCVC